MAKTEEQVSIRSSAAEYLTFVASTGDSDASVEMRYEDENIWLTQKMMAVLYDVDVRTVNYHIKKIFEDSELQEDSTIRKFRIVQNEGSRQIERGVNHYSLQMIIAVGFKVNSERAVQFRKWVNQIATEYTIKGWVMDDERLKKGTYLTDKYFDEQLERVREIRASERKFYQKITDFELSQLNRMVTSYLDFAENMAMRKIPLTMQDWEKRLNTFIEMFEYGLLQDAGKVSAEIAKLHAETEFEKYRIIQDRMFMSDFDRFMLELEEKTKSGNSQG